MVLYHNSTALTIWKVKRKDVKYMRLKLKEAIKACGVSQKELAKEIGITPMHLSCIVNCKKNPSKYVTLCISKRLGITTEDVLSVEEIA